jgi:AcrR family transcriptional regulator
MTMTPRQLAALEKAFLDRGFETITMTAIAKAIGFTRRALYHHYSSKEEAFRVAMIFQNARGMQSGRTAAELAFTRGNSAVTVMHALLDARFGDTRRTVAQSPHAQELSDTVFRLCGDLINDLAATLHAQLAEMLERLQASGRLKLRSDITIAELAYLLAAGVRGVSQSRPLPKESEYSPRYRAIITAILRGSAKIAPE